MQRIKMRTLAKVEKFESCNDLIDFLRQHQNKKISSHLPKGLFIRQIWKQDVAL
jgi:hypothetical protein